MAVTGQQLLSKIIDTGSTQALAKYNVKRSDFSTPAEREAYDFIVKFGAENGGDAPSYATYSANVRTVTYIPEVTDSFEYLAGELKDATGKRELAEYINSPEFTQSYETLPTEAFINSLTDRLSRIKMETRTGVPNMTDISTAGERFLTEFRARKAGTSFRIWLSKFGTINEKIGGYFSGNTYAWYARSGRGKSVMVMEDAIEAAFQGANVLIWALEMSEYEWMARAYSSISARISETIRRIDGVDYTVGFDNRAMLMGTMDADYERGLAAFVDMLAEVVPGRIVIRAADSENFTQRSIAQLEVDIAEIDADVVVVDPIYLMDFERNTSNVAGGDVAATSVKLKRLAGQTKTVIHVVTQAEEDAKEKNEDGTRELSPPPRAGIKKSKAILEDAANVFGIDTLAQEGRGVIELGKGRNGGEDTRVEIVYLPNYGVVRELDTQGQAQQFASVSGF
ncbi:DnaB-like helicase C-terminal domain-containing protein [Paenibacillus sp. UASWS1643]|uniref:DnaB-like helicase C-terminal domain-containing protein n=1 Tax=Paenibacillus sp. UASWS1643 TaxID=2580422 RepID=UPI00123B7FD3|nr:DnaB-like helicase C-terminal domain-containing protein [Paenibacillus sp. UASWS1643]KAA8750191.1 AAA family ATPase [Paenibacillus sp. UASWS1643]